MFNIYAYIRTHSIRFSVLPHVYWPLISHASVRGTRTYIYGQLDSTQAGFRFFFFLFIADFFYLALYAFDFRPLGLFFYVFLFFGFVILKKRKGIPWRPLLRHQQLKSAQPILEMMKNLYTYTYECTWMDLCRMYMLMLRLLVCI